MDFMKLYSSNVKEQIILIGLLVSAENLRDSLLEDLRQQND